MRSLMYALVLYTAIVALGTLVMRLAVRGWRTPVARHLTAMSFALALAFGLWAASIVLGPLPTWVWVATVAHIAIVVTWRLVLQIRGQIEGT